VTIRATDPGRSNGTEGWHEEDARHLAGACGAATRGAGSARRKDKLAFWEDGGLPARPAAECALPAPRRTPGGHAAARRWENAVGGAPARSQSTTPPRGARGRLAGGAGVELAP